MTRDEFHIHLYGPLQSTPKTDAASATNALEANSNEPDPLAVTASLEPNGQIPTTAIPASFEEAASRLAEELPEVLLEPDGSLAWASPDHQVVGMIYDAMGSIQYLELRGHCTAEQLRRLVVVISGVDEIGQFAVMVLPERQWKNFQSVAESFKNRPEDAAKRSSD